MIQFRVLYEPTLNEIVMQLEGSTVENTNSTQALQQRITRTENGREGFLLYGLIHVLNFRSDLKNSARLKSPAPFGRCERGTVQKSSDLFPPRHRPYRSALDELGIDHRLAGVFPPLADVFCPSPASSSLPLQHMPPQPLTAL